MKPKGRFSGDTREPQGTRADGTPFRVLVVDDSLFVTKQISQILTSEGFEVVATAKDGIEGVEKYKQLKDELDLVTMDITMPRMDGVSALKQILQFDPEAVVVMVSALGKQDLVKESLVAGAKNFIVKPLDRQKVIERVVICLK